MITLPTTFEEEALDLREVDRIQREQDAQADVFASTKAGITVQEVKKRRIAVKNQADSRTSDPEFAVFRGGYGQVSPLYNVMMRCKGM